MKKKPKLVPLLPEVWDLHLDDDDRLEAKMQHDIMDYLKTVPCSNLAKIAQGPWSKNGVVDIVGCYHGRSLAMEVKRRTKEPTPLQSEYLNDNVKAEGFSAVVRSVADVKEVLLTVEREIVKQKRTLGDY